MKFDSGCKRCSRLVDYLCEQKRKFPHYYCAPVPPIGPEFARVLIVGLAPGLHGANATGVPFMGDTSGELLFRTLFETGFSLAPEALDAENKGLVDCRITNAVKCLPPQNKPGIEEFRNCQGYLEHELSDISLEVVVALGKMAHDAVLRSHRIPLSAARFAHAAEHRLSPALLLVDSYHCSRYNTQTRRLTPEMFKQVFLRVSALLSESGKTSTCRGAIDG
ncbi:MAG: uracil-DNA glycosylase [bacterium]